MSKIGLLGGTFDPFHFGHLAAADAAVDCAELDRVIFIPAAQPPHRPPAVASPEQRLEMCRLGIEGEPRFEVSDLELKRQGPSYTVDTLAQLRKEQPDDELFLILGWDAAKLFSTWHEPEKVLELATIVVVARPGGGAPRQEDLRGVGLEKAKVVLCLTTTPDVSASEIRKAVAAGEAITGKAPKAVERYIGEHRLYAG
ncbi:MAG: nicotinate-nucleotide adenylyltransferase [Chloroflexota bacterium]|jgi:nicotinate-nucleotide adenylyltransferase|nr:nicotinate-nucleotide adenylyltransferase [Chloroflexota bacterium]